MSIEAINENAVWLNEGSADIKLLREATARITDPTSVPLASRLVSEIPVYDGQAVRDAADIQADAPQRARAFQQEWAQILLSGAGAVVIENAVDSLALLDQVTDAFYDIIKRESESDSGADHFAPKGSNTRIWNGHEKLCVEAPELYARYNANDVMSLMCKAWLGPGYQITAQANIVHPGGQAQHCHRDYHMGFQTTERLYEYPSHVHAMSPMLTLQGAIAHSDMPLESGPTKLLPFSQTFLPGYLSTARTDCIEWFEAQHVQLPLKKGDMLFFSPALMHAAGDNKTSDIDRFANLVQVGSAYARTMELLDKTRMSLAVYPVLQQLQSSPDWQERFSRYVIEATAEGYAFPANMELEPPLNGLAPLSQQDILSQSLAAGDAIDVVTDKLLSQCSLKRSH
jgi:ectoine hydroxylase-related dioxygenase (phytanoyl-CoA dioxygenase family)